MSFVFYFALFLFLILCCLLIFTILIQESKSMGLGASFGGDSGDSLFGTSTADVLKKFTAYMIVIFMISCMVLSFWTSSLGRAHNRAMSPAVEEVQQ